jgi:hypothetical protein
VPRLIGGTYFYVPIRHHDVALRLISRDAFVSIYFCVQYRLLNFVLGLVAVVEIERAFMLKNLMAF